MTTAAGSPTENMPRNFLCKTEVRVGYDSDVRAPSPRRYKTHPPGTRLVLNSEAPNGNVWFIDPDGERGKIECGQVSNLTARGTLEEIPEN